MAGLELRAERVQDFIYQRLRVALFPGYRRPAGDLAGHLVGKDAGDVPDGIRPAVERTGDDIAIRPHGWSHPHARGDVSRVPAQAAANALAKRAMTAAARLHRNW